MKTGSAVLGILGGALALVIGVLSYFLGDLGQTLGIEGSVTRQVLSLALPIAALVGGGVAPQSGLLMAASAAGILIVLEIGVFSLITAIPIGIGALLAFIGSASGTRSAPA